MFFKGKKESKKNESDLSDDLLDFLDDADESYIRAYETRNIVILKKFFTRECCISLSVIIAAEGSTRYFSSEKFRTTEWTLLSKTTSSLTVLKSVVYRDIKVAGGSRMKVSTDYKEEWHLDITNKDYLVTKVVSA